MSTLEDLDDLEGFKKDDQKDEGDKDGDDKKKDQNGAKDGGKDEEMKDLEEDVLDAEILNSNTRDIISRKRLLENDMRIMKSEFQRLTHEKGTMREKIKDNIDKIDNNRYGLSGLQLAKGLPPRFAHMLT